MPSADIRRLVSMKPARIAAPALAALCWTAGEARAQSQPAAGDSQGTIVVTAPPRGEAEVAAETEFDEPEIASFGADSIDELLDRLAPLIDASAGEPVILVNGKEIGFDRSILAYPPEALNRIAVLKAEAAAHYGHPSGRRVVNLVLKRRYASRHVEAAASGATGGGQYGGDVTAGQVAIAGETRWNVQGRLSLDSALRRSARDVPAEAGPVDLVGYVASSGHGAIDPALSKTAGEIVSAAAMPWGAMIGSPSLADFAARAGRTHPADPARFETLLPSRRNASLNLGATRPLGPFSASLSVNASSNRSINLRGIAMASVTLPAGSPWSPFSGDVMLVRPLAGDRALRSENHSRSLSVSLALSGKLGSWRTTLSGNYARSWASSRIERDIDTRLAQALIDAGERTFNPYGPWGERLLLASGSRSDSESIGARFNAARPVVDLPTGAVTANFSLDANHSSSGYRRFDGGDAVAGEAKDIRERLGGELSFAIPVARRTAGDAGLLGDLTLDLSLGGQTVTGSGLRKQYGGGFTWSPAPWLEILGSFKHREVVPSAEQLGAPRVETLTRIYDFSRQEMAEPLWITGGNPLLHRGSRQNLSLDLRIRPLGNAMLSVNVGYRRSRGEGGIAPFPELTPAIEAAFPERVVRDAEGRLQAVDARAINIARTESTELVSGVALRLPTPGDRPNEGRERAQSPLRISLALNHTWRLKSALLTRTGIPVIDQLAETGQPRHHLSLRATAGKEGIGADMSATWSSPAQVRGRHASGVESAYRYQPPLTIDAGFFVVPGRIGDGTDEGGWLDDLKLSFDVKNLLDTYRRVTLGDGSVPSGFGRHEIDPLGRTVEFSVRKRF